MMGFILVFGSYILLLNLLKNKNLLIEKEKYFICDEMLCL